MTQDFRPERFDARFAVHAASSAVLLWLAAILFMPGDTFAAAKGWRLFERWGSEHAWSLAFCCVGWFGLLGLTTGSRLLRLVSIGVVSTALATVALFMAAGAPEGAGSGVYAIWALLGYYLTWRRAQELPAR